jgi:hypothetical protein
MCRRSFSNVKKHTYSQKIYMALYLLFSSSLIFVDQCDHVKSIGDAVSSAGLKGSTAHLLTGYVNINRICKYSLRMQTYVHTYIHTCIHTYILARIHTHIYETQIDTFYDLEIYLACRKTFGQATDRMCTGKYSDHINAAQNKLCLLSNRGNICVAARKKTKSYCGFLINTRRLHMNRTGK